MLGKTSRVLVIVLALLALVGTVSAQVNNPVNGFMGGDNLYCNSARGCYLLNAKGVLLGEFPQTDVQDALTTCAAEAHNVIIGTIDGTFGPFTLSAVYDGPNAKPICSLQFNGFEGEAKESKSYTFIPNSDGSYQSVGVPVEANDKPAGICNGASVGDYVSITSDGTDPMFGTIIAIFPIGKDLFFDALVIDDFGDPQTETDIPCSMVYDIL